MDVKDYTSLISATAAVLSLAVNFYLVRNHRPQVAKKEDVRLAIRDTLNVLQSRLLSVSEFEEVWNQGFKSLANIVSVVGQARTTIEASPPGIAPQAVRRSISDLHQSLSNLYDLQDSWYRFSQGNKYVSDAAQWKDRTTAEHRLRAVQDTYNRTRGELNACLDRLSG